MSLRYKGEGLQRKRGLLDLSDKCSWNWMSLCVSTSAMADHTSVDRPNLVVAQSARLWYFGFSLTDEVNSHERINYC